MSQSTKVGIIGAGWPGVAHGRGYRAAGGYQIVAVADLIPERRQKLTAELGKPREYADAQELIKDPTVEVVSICLPTHLHLLTARAALKAGKHVILETPPGLSAREANQLASAAAKANRFLTYAYQRRFGGAELASKQAIDKGYAGEPYHARATWMRTRGVPIGIGWYTDRSKSGGGALVDLGSHMLDIAWHLLGEPKPLSAFAVTHQKFREMVPPELRNDVEDAAFALLKFDGGKTLELGVSWAINQAPAQNGTTCRVYGAAGAVEVYTPQGPVLYRGFDSSGQAKQTPLKQPKVIGHAAMFRQFRESMIHNRPPSMGPAQGIALMRMMEALYHSAETGKSVEVKSDPAPTGRPVIGNA